MGGWHAIRAQHPNITRTSPLMITRSRIFITAALVCHLFLASRIVTSQTLPPESATVAAPESTSTSHPTSDPTSVPTGAAALPAAPASQTEEEVTIRAVEQEKDGPVYHLRGKAE